MLLQSPTKLIWVAVVCLLNFPDSECFNEVIVSLEQEKPEPQSAKAGSPKCGMVLDSVVNVFEFSLSKGKTVNVPLLTGTKAFGMLFVAASASRTFGVVH